MHLTSQQSLTTSIRVLPYITVLRFDDAKWQLATYVPPAPGKQLDSATVVRPDAQAEELTLYFGGPWFNGWWSIGAPEPGTYQWRLRYTDGSVEEVSIWLPESIFTSIERPVPLTPLDGDIVNTTQPRLTFHVSGGAQEVYVRLRKKDAPLRDEQWFRVTSPGEFQVPPGVLEPGESYVWMVHTINGKLAFPWTEAQSDEWEFSVTE